MLLHILNDRVTEHCGKAEALDFGFIQKFWSCAKQNEQHP
jgi:hypothetical protein